MPDRPLRVLIVMPYPDGQAGASRSVEITAQHFNRRRIEATVITGREGTLSRAVAATGRADVIIEPSLPEALVAHVGPHPRGLAIPFVVVRNSVLYIRFAYRLAKLARTTKADLIVANCLHPKVVCLFSAWLARIPLIWHVRVVRTGGVLRLLLLLGRRKTVRKILCISRSAAEPFRHRLADKVVVVPNGVALSPAKDTSANLRTELGIDDKCLLIGLVGRVVPLKGVDDFLAAAVAICAERSDVLFVVLGTTPRNETKNYEKRYREEVDRKGLGESVRFLGHRDDIDSLLPQLDILVQPSRCVEAFGRTLIEGMAAHVAVVASKIGGMPEVLGLDENEANSNKTLWTPYGAVFPPRDVPRLIQVLVRLLDNEVLRQQIADSGRKRVEEMYSAQITTRMYEDALIAAIKKNSG